MIKGIGIDIVEIARIELNIASKVLSKEEMSVFDDMSLVRKREFLAGRFAIKEALYKAGIKESFSKLNVKYKKDNSIYLDDYPNVKVSISHEKNYAIGFAINQD